MNISELRLFTARGECRTHSLNPTLFVVTSRTPSITAASPSSRHTDGRGNFLLYCRSLSIITSLSSSPDSVARFVQCRLSPAICRAFHKQQDLRHCVIHRLECVCQTNTSRIFLKMIADWFHSFIHLNEMLMLIDSCRRRPNGATTLESKYSPHPP